MADDQYLYVGYKSGDVLIEKRSAVDGGLMASFGADGTWNYRVSGSLADLRLDTSLFMTGDADSNGSAVTIRLD